MKLQALQTLIQVAEAGSVRAASIRWRRNLAPMIALMRILESELGFALLEDHGGAKAIGCARESDAYPAFRLFSVLPQQSIQQGVP